MRGPTPESSSLAMLPCALTPCLSSAGWEEEVCAYLDSHPGVTIIDPPKAVRTLGNRETMLQLLDDKEWFMKVRAKGLVGGWSAGPHGLLLR